MPKGVNPAATVESVNEFTSLKFPSYISTLLLAESAAKRKFPEAVAVIASPVYTAPEDELLTMIVAWLRFTCGDHALIVPSSVANRNNAFHPWKTIPVGAPAPFPVAEGITTCRDCLTPLPV